MFDDSDVKIFDDKGKANENYDEIAAIHEMTKQRNNGNSDRAKKLGKHLAEIFVDEPNLLKELAGEVGNLDYSDDIMYQIKVLIIFTAEYTINHTFPSALLSNTAINAMHDTLKKHAAEFYDRLDDAAEYSFYYLAVRKGNDISKGIGKSFAMLCNKSDYAELGQNIFEVVQKEIQKIIDSFKFVM